MNHWWSILFSFVLNIIINIHRKFRHSTWKQQQGTICKCLSQRNSELRLKFQTSTQLFSLLSKCSLNKTFNVTSSWIHVVSVGPSSFWAEFLNKFLKNKTKPSIPLPVKAVSLIVQLWWIIREGVGSCLNFLSTLLLTDWHFPPESFWTSLSFKSQFFSDEKALYFPHWPLHSVYDALIPT